MFWALFTTIVYLLIFSFIVGDSYKSKLDLLTIIFYLLKFSHLVGDSDKSKLFIFEEINVFLLVVSLFAMDSDYLRANSR